MRHPDVVRAYLRLNAHFLHLLDDIVARASLRGRARDVGFARQLLRVRRRNCRRRTTSRVRLELALSLCIGGGEAWHCLLGCCSAAEACEQNEKRTSMHERIPESCRDQLTLGAA